MGEPALFAKPVFGFAGEIGHTPLAEKFRRDSFGGGFIGDVLGAILAKLRV